MTTRIELIDPAAVTQFRVLAVASLVAWLAPFIAYAALLRGRQPSDTVIGGFLLLTLAWIVAVVGARLWLERHRVVHTVTFPLQAIGDVGVGRDWNIGCVLMILLSPLIGLLYLAFTRGRVVSVTAPFAADRKGPLRLRLKGSTAEGQYLQRLLLGPHAPA